MQVKENAYRVLVVSHNERMAHAIAKILISVHFTAPTISDSISQAKRLVVERHFDFVIVSSPVGGEDALEFVLDTHHSYGPGIILLTKEGQYDEAFDKTHELGIITLAKPTQTELFIQALQMLVTSKDRLENMKLKQGSNLSLKDKMAEIRLTNEAKLLLMKYEKVTESEAHHLILKMAMDIRISKTEVAHRIIEQYSKKREEENNE